MADKAVIGERDMTHALAEAIRRLTAFPRSSRQPSAQGFLNNFADHFSKHGLIDTDSNLMQRLALRESARVAMVRLHYSQSMRKAELARSLEPSTATISSPGDVVYFWRAPSR